MVFLVTKLLSKIEEMETQRFDLSSKLQQELKDDDITGKLAGEPEHTHESIYQKEIKKHDLQCGYLRQNLAAQEMV